MNKTAPLQLNVPALIMPVLSVLLLANCSYLHRTKTPSHTPLLTIDDPNAPLTLILDGEKSFFGYLMLTGRIKFKALIPTALKLTYHTKGKNSASEKTFAIEEISHISPPYKKDHWIPFFVRNKIPTGQSVYQLRIIWGKEAVIALEKEVYPKYLKAKIKDITFHKKNSESTVKLEITNTSNKTLSNPIILFSFKDKKQHTIMEKTVFLPKKFKPLSSYTILIPLKKEPPPPETSAPDSKITVLSVQANYLNAH